MISDEISKAVMCEEMSTGKSGAITERVGSRMNPENPRYLDVWVSLCIKGMLVNRLKMLWLL